MPWSGRLKGGVVFVGWRQSPVGISNAIVLWDGRKGITLLVNPAYFPVLPLLSLIYNTQPLSQSLSLFHSMYIYTDRHWKPLQISFLHFRSSSCDIFLSSYLLNWSFFFTNFLRVFWKPKIRCFSLFITLKFLFFNSKLVYCVLINIV